MTPNQLRVADVLLDANSAGGDAEFTYEAGPDVEVGQARLVTLAGRTALGYVRSVREVSESELGFDPVKLRPLGPLIPGLRLPHVLMDIVREVAKTTLSSPSAALTLVMPSGAKDRLVTRWVATGVAPESPLPIVSNEVLESLRDLPITEKKGEKVAPSIKRALRDLEKFGLVRRELELDLPAEKKAPISYHLTEDGAKIERFLTGLGRKRPAQSMAVVALQGSDRAGFTAAELRTMTGVTDRTLKALIAAELLVEVAQESSPTSTAPEPNADQKAALDAITDRMQAREATGFLLYGVTGSGKTEVYLRAASEALRLGRQVLYLVPEIALTAQVVAQLRERFGHRIAILHSNLTPVERLRQWQRVQTGDAPLVLGPRSALFAPLDNLGLIVVDEEHEGSYKQESSPRYDTRRLAKWLAQEHGCPVVFGSATPSLESFHAAQTGNLGLLRLPRRAAEAQLPTVEIEDLRLLYRTGRASILGPQLHDALSETLNRKEQAILFLNRRAYSPVLQCRDCGHRFDCPQCAVGLAFHRRDNALRCHHCDHKSPVPTQCPKCEGGRIAPVGVGVERVEETLLENFPDARVARLDRDIARRKGALDEILTQFRGGDLDILVGTQMVAKGFDFPRVTLVGVIAADVSLNVPDFRAAERTFQLLAQVSGRAGRAHLPGRVVIQTFNPDHASIARAIAHDYDGFASAELGERVEWSYPPFVRLVNVIISGEDKETVETRALNVAIATDKAMPGAAVLGPAPCPLERRQSQWRNHVLIKLPPGADPSPLREPIERLMDNECRIVIDVDPASLV
ncbi:MAG: primosomal protein N' [Fimbriimonadaceae bacterium]|nr:primosomal protein N' [Fimbriimonadaceae bacterium]